MAIMVRKDNMAVISVVETTANRKCGRKRDFVREFATTVYLRSVMNSLYVELSNLIRVGP
jgi:hypothetical protein